ncbi:hypothetical protein IT087_04020 [Candidatus Uhrbacteria bacterium]|nr:hypothetical protein [Candidatus Uhrbacteria bacterium]
MSNRFGFYGVLGGITLALLVSKLMGCASPASASEMEISVSEVEVTVEVIGERTVEYDGDTTITTEPGELILYSH